MNLSPPPRVSRLRRVATSADAAPAPEMVAAAFRPSDGQMAAACLGVAADALVAAAGGSGTVAIPVLTSPSASPAFAVENAVLDRFVEDLRTAPELIGELTVLYVEQHPRLAIRLIARALRVRPGATV